MRLRGRCRSAEVLVDAPRGFEPRLTESESVVLPLDDGAAKRGQLVWPLPGVKRPADGGPATGGALSLLRLGRFATMGLSHRPPGGQEWKEPGQCRTRGRAT